MTQFMNSRRSGAGHHGKNPLEGWENPLETTSANGLTTRRRARRCAKSRQKSEIAQTFPDPRPGPDHRHGTHVTYTSRTIGAPRRTPPVRREPWPRGSQSAPVLSPPQIPPADLCRSVVIPIRPAFRAGRRLRACSNYTPAGVCRCCRCRCRHQCPTAPFSPPPAMHLARRPLFRPARSFACARAA